MPPPESVPPVERRVITPLNALRVIFTLTVLIYHSAGMIGRGSEPLGRLALEFHGLTVCFFFILSGFVLERTFKPGGRLKHRLARVLPGHWLWTGLACLCAAGLGQELPSPQGLAASLTLTQAWFEPQAVHFGCNRVAWTLSVELLCYLALPFLHRLKTRGLATVAVACYGVVLLIDARHPQVDAYWLWYVFPLARLPEFMVGMTIARVSGEKLSRIPHAEWLATLLLGGTLLLRREWAPAWAAHALIFLPAMTLTVIAFASGKGPLSRLFSHPWFDRAAKYTLAFYLCHDVCLSVVGYTNIGWNRPLGLITFLETLALTGFCAVVTAPVFDALAKRLSGESKRPGTVRYSATKTPPGSLTVPEGMTGI